MNTFLRFAAASALILPFTCHAQSSGWKPKETTSTAGEQTTVTNSYEKPIGNSGVTAGPMATTTYTKPGNGPNGPVPGNQAGSSTSTGYGVSVTIPLPEKNK